MCRLTYSPFASEVEAVAAAPLEVDARATGSIESTCIFIAISKFQLHASNMLLATS